MNSDQSKVATHQYGGIDEAKNGESHFQGEHIYESERSTVFVVDDDPMTRLLMRESLEQSGLIVFEAEDGLELKEKFEEFLPDIILLDVEMPRLDGYDTCEFIRSCPHGQFTPILMVTGREDVESVNRAYEVGATDFISKPINWTILAHRVRYMLRAAESLDDLRHSEERNNALIQAIPDLMIRLNRDGRYLDYQSGDAAFTIAGEDKKETIVGRHMSEILPDKIYFQILSLMPDVLCTGDSASFEGMVELDSGVCYYEARIVLCGEAEVVVIIRDITERTKAEEQIRYMAYFDRLTALPNRDSIQAEIDQLVKRGGEDKRIPLLFLDLDHFKRINDTLGHKIGDLLLQGVARRLKDCLTDILPGVSVVGDEQRCLARFGGDEFIILLSKLQSVDKEKVSIIARQILRTLGKVFLIQGHEIFITPSIGIATYPEDGDNAVELIKNADTAKCHAKENGRNSFEFYIEKMNERSKDRLKIENCLRRAQEKNEFQLFYQPQLCLGSGEIIGVEALIRWTCSELGPMSPAVFIPIAEEMGLIIDIGEWVLREACAQMKKWKSMNFGLGRMSVNLSSIQFYQSNLMSLLDEILRETELDPMLLELELTESLIMRNATNTIEALHEIRRMGIRLSVDDFGTGYSSLSYLKRFPIDSLKIDRSFIKDLEVDSEDAAITFAIIAMAHSLNLRVVAEGVENARQLDFLRERDCDEIQGFYFSKPVPAQELTQMLADGKKLE